MSSTQLHLGDCLDVLRSMDSASVDAIVTDPPYGISMMGKAWDYQVPSVEIWEECLRVLKPGGHLLAFAGTRTQHRMCVNIEDAGFQIRDMIAWVYGSGFPKSMDISKAIDKAGGLSPELQSRLLSKKRIAAGLSREEVAQAVGCTVSSVRDWEEGRSRAKGRPIEYILPSPDYRAKLADLLGYSSDERNLVGSAQDRRGDKSTYGLGHSGLLTSGGNTAASKQWDGWGTALKPALEPITVARKPLKGTVANNVLTHGTGAINIDGCRVGSEGGTTKGSKPQGAGHGIYGAGLHGACEIRQLNAGRWPANLIHDGSDEVVELTGDAARFFYCPKANKKDREDGNTHPTVKPTDLMAYLCRLVTPADGVVLDPFMGSGSTGKAAMREGFGFIGIERDEDYFEIASSRIAIPAQPQLSLIV